MEASPRNESALGAGTSRPGRENVIPTSVNYEAGRGAVQAEADLAPMLAAALAYAAEGVPVFPCIPESKKPYTAHGFHDASTDPEIIRRWWAEWPDAMIGMPTGAASGRDVLDVDMDELQGKDGEAALAALVAKHGRLPDTQEVLTPRGGRHLHFLTDPARPLRCSTSKVGADLDIRGAGGYVILPRSRRAGGAAYEWELSSHPDDVPLAPMPEWLRALAGAGLMPGGAQQAASLPQTQVTEDVLADLRSALYYLDPCSRDTWINVAHALRTIPDADGWALWSIWSRGDLHPDFPDVAQEARKLWGSASAVENRKTWESCRPTGTDYRAIFAEAARNGWVNPMAGGGERAGPATDAADPGLLSEREAETLLAWAWHTGATLPSADDSGIFLGPKNPQTGKASERLRVKVRLSSDHTAPWIKIAWGSGPDSFMAEVDRYIPRREELVDQENLRRMERSAKPQEDISSADLRSHAVAWLARVRGLAVSDEVGRALFERVGGSCGIWPEPQPITAKIAPEPYPLDALPLAVRAAVEEVAGFVKAPIPLVVSSALAALSLAIQAHADAKRAEKLHGPTGLFLLTIADSGERKSTCDGFFTQAIREYEAAKAEADKPLLKDHAAAIGAWEAKRAGVKEKIRQLAKEGKSAESMERDLRDLEHGEPAPPRIPRLLYADATPEALAYGLSKQWPSAGVVSAEAGIVFGSHGMGKDSVMRNLGLLNQLWDGATLTIDRRSTESFTVRGARLTVALQVQEPTLREFFNRSGALARGSGFLARFLVAWPESTQGHRPFTEAPANWPHLAAFHQRITAILAQPAPIDEDGALTPPMLSLTPEAKALWVAYHDAIERELSSGGELYDVRDVASKSADNAVRLAALFQVFEGAGGAIGAEAFDGASRITAWHLNEARRFFGELALPAELADAARLDSWLIDHCQQKLEHTIGKSVALQYGPLRKKESLDAAIRELAELDRVRVVKDGKRLTLTLNPALLGFANAKAANPANDGGMDP